LNSFLSIVPLVLKIMALLLVLSDSAVASQPVPTIEVSEDSEFPLYVRSNLLFLKDSSRSLTIDSILNAPNDWREVNKPSPNFGFTNAAHWFRFDVTNSDDSEREVYFEIPVPYLDDIEVYQLRLDESVEVLESYHVGDKYVFEQRPLSHQNFVLPFNLAPGNNQFLMRIASEGTVEASVIIWDSREFGIESRVDHLIVGIWFGMVSIMIIYNLFLYLSLRNKTTLYYVVFVFSYLMFEVTLKGYSYAFLWPNMVEWNRFALSSFIAVSNCFATLFLISFLKLKQISVLGYRFMRLLALLSFVMAIASVTESYSYTIRINSLMAIVVCISSLIFGYYAWFKGEYQARYYCLAWSSAGAGIAVLGLVRFGLLPSNIWTNSAGQIGVVLLVALLSFALANGLNRQKELRLQAQEESLESEKLARQTKEKLLVEKTNLNLRLEEQVKERTEALQTALKEMEVLSNTDVLTGLYNRRYFECRSNEEFKRAKRHGKDLSVILCDLDYFKHINDTYGHKAGDECLCKVAAELQKRLQRSGDVVARYGGEEFIILLVDTPRVGAERLAECIRERISALQLEIDGKHVQITASFGVSSLLDEESENVEQLIHLADSALYQAKDNGRNQVVSG